jgi:hypothetical protein
MKGSQESLTTVVVKSWPTPNCMDVITPNRDLMQMESKGHWGKGMNTGKLSEMVKSWPTPNAADPRQGGTTQGARKPPNLSIAIYGPPAPVSSSTSGSRQGLSQEGRLWMTPKSGACGMTATTSGRPLERATQLTTQVHVVEKQWQTATVSTGANKQKDGSMTDKLDQQVKNYTSGKLNPRWVETLMGLPVGWTMPSCKSPVTIERTSFDSSETVLSQQQQNEPLEY